MNLSAGLQTAGNPASPEAPIQACSPTCLLHGRDTFVAIRPIRAGTGFLYRTPTGKLVKKKKHYGAEPQKRLGIHFPFRQERQDVAFSLLRTHRPPGVVIPERECACSYEMAFVRGEMLCPRSSHYYEGLSKRFGARGFKGREEATYFIREACACLRRLHDLGILHGDPGYNNFLLTSQGVHLLDIDDAVYLGAGMQDWEYIWFLIRTLGPILSEYYSVHERFKFYSAQGLSPKRLAKGLITRLFLAAESCWLAIKTALHQACGETPVSPGTSPNRR